MADLFGDLDDGVGPTDFPDLAPDASSGNQPAGLGSMLAAIGDDDDFYAPPPSAAPPAAPAFSTPAAPPSALIEWQRQKDADLAEQDAKEAEASKELAAKARKGLDDYYQTIRTQQEKRAKANEDADLVLVADLESDGNPWQKVGKLINLQANPVRSTDLSRFRTLLIQLKQ
jgi:hypothetical protein